MLAVLLELLKRVLIGSLPSGHGPLLLRDVLSLRPPADDAGRDRNDRPLCIGRGTDDLASRIDEAQGAAPRVRVITLLLSSLAGQATAIGKFGE
jgi:hypothetical protein